MLIVVAGMEGALPSVVGGLVDRPVIAVPTSVGYGASLRRPRGAARACSTPAPPASTVVNIDNGFGAAAAAARINRAPADGRTSPRARAPHAVGRRAHHLGRRQLPLAGAQAAVPVGVAAARQALLETHIRNARRVVERSKELRGAFMKLAQMLSMRQRPASRPRRSRCCRSCSRRCRRCRGRRCASVLDARAGRAARGALRVASSTRRSRRRRSGRCTARRCASGEAGRR